MTTTTTTVSQAPVATVTTTASSLELADELELEELQRMVGDDSNGDVAATTTMTIVTEEQRADDNTDAAVWHDMRPTARSYVDEDGHTGPRQPLGRQISAALPGFDVTLGEVTYESAFRLIQQAAEAERGGDPLRAVDLYVSAGKILISVGRNEQDPLLRQGIQEKALEVSNRAEQLNDWYSSVQEKIRWESLPPQLRIQKTDVPRVQESWHGRRPPFNQGDEFTHMRYTAVTTKDPYHFTDEGFTLRVHQLQRKIRTFITVTMYNEEGPELKGTLTGIARNLAYMAEVWGEHAWENVAVAIVSDGRTKASASCLDYLTSLGAFDEEIMTVTSAGVDVQMHLFESTVQFMRDDNFEAFYPPIQIIYALKEHNGGKLNSHLWFFNAFSEQLLPTYTVLVDVGTIPGPDSIFRLVRSMDRNPQIGGVAGEIAVEQPNYFNPVIAAQHFEYKISNIMDKSLESVFGFISVLPGAFSAYRYEAIRAEKGAGPLPEYFRSLTTSTKDLGPFKGNMYLAEDRILCFELLARKKQRIS
ncbi:hypothetical protein P43SY_007612 [Pythium insidiosum]|uniref:chitin synthase n=1 Tax=Pythium insidiosum TaxID=114742 RepID=A0AAD5LK21_PYTIN|nr:hypothetical protein P43SY_007612 [Pythium insidiosum]